MWIRSLRTLSPLVILLLFWGESNAQGFKGFFVVPKGLTLPEISVYFYGSPQVKAQEIAKLNNLKSISEVRAGQELYLAELPKGTEEESIQRLHAMWKRVGKPIPSPRTYPKFILFPEAHPTQSLEPLTTQPINETDKEDLAKAHFINEKTNCSDLIKSGQLQEAQVKLESILKEHPDDTASLLRQISVESRLGNHSKSRALAEKLVESAPQFKSLPMIESCLQSGTEAPQE